MSWDVYCIIFASIYISFVIFIKKNNKTSCDIYTEFYVVYITAFGLSDYLWYFSLY